MNLLQPETALLDDIRVLSSNLVGRIRGFVDDTRVRRIAANYSANAEQRRVDLGFNAFALVSDIYYRENFHSDIMVAILDPRGAHGHGDRFLRLFLEFLRDRHHLDINPDDYRNAQVVRESARIDVLIWDKTSGKAIIVENKINGAGDMDRQVARYLEEVEDVRHMTCDAIIYLTLQLKGWPGTHGWHDDEKDRVNRLLKPICAFADAPDDLYSGWLGPCVGLAADSSLEVAHVIRQYRQLILKLGQNAMNQPLMEEFYSLLKEGERYKAAVQVADIMKQLPAFRCQRLYEGFLGRREPFFGLSIYGNTTLIFEGLPIEGGARIKIDIDNDHPCKTTVSFWDNADRPDHKLPRKILDAIHRTEDFNETSDGRPAKSFDFPSGEEDLDKFIEKFLASLQGYVRPASA
jgi:hypothetical protein